MSRLLVKVCGLADAGDARLALELGADLLGVVLAPGPRQVPVALARAIRLALPAGAPVVAVFRDQPAELVREVMEFVRPAMLQFHGDEPPAFCASFGLPYIKALEAPAAGATGWPASRPWHASAALLLADLPKGDAGALTAARGAAAVACGRPVLLAGGLTPENVAGIARGSGPAGVDVARGVESSPGHKDPGRLASFLAAVREIGNTTAGEVEER